MYRNLAHCTTSVKTLFTSNKGLLILLGMRFNTELNNSLTEVEYNY